MFADTLLRAEQLYMLRLTLWGAANILAGTAVLVLVAVIWRHSPLLRAFGATCAVLGGLEMIGGWTGYRSAELRDYAAAVRLDRLLWLELGACAGTMLAGVVLATTAWRLARRFALVGTGVAVVMHATAVALLDAQLVTVISR